MLTNIVTLKSRSEVTQGHSNGTIRKQRFEKISIIIEYKVER